ncbi:putative DNA damage repair protein Mus42 [Aspergillus chevalieri]|uniref:DNA repair protein REV1 n=1 Tax=Aspergillus chevalieri TaxID=182096 RepID=A0A7R7VXS3_ASPCH|nr:deoxycytidyl transferase [Aspergillus chevalieri]BCR92729.1 deoxycytidyl transferase [Aspergillus chevalieri]
MGSQLDANSSAVRKRIENHSFNGEEGEEYEASSFGGFSDYMRRKKIKLQNLDAEIRASSADNPPIFRGVVAHVNGYTQPSLQDLHHLIVSHGGGFVQYLESKTAATHIIASSLTPKKREEFRRYRIVKPAWVVESVQAGRMLPWEHFKVVDEGQTQKVLKFNSGRLLSQTNSPRTGYNDQTSSSWYTSQLKLPIERKDTAPRSTPPETTGNSDEPLNATSQSDYGEFPSFSALDERQQPSDDVQGNELPDSRPSVDLPEQIGARSFSPTSPNKAKQTPSLSPKVPTLKPDLTSEEYNAQLLNDPRMRGSSVVNPEFLQQYYRESRLHHLSAWKAELKAQLQVAAKEKTISQAGKKKRAPGARRYILHVDFDCFFAAVSTLKHPELSGKPVAIAHGTGTGSEIASCNYVARSHGVKNGMWMKGALQACPELQVLPYDFSAYEDASRKFYSAVLAIDGVVQSVSIDEALVDITSSCLEAGGTDGRGISEGSIYREQLKADEIAQSLRDSVKATAGCAVSVGIGGNILLAKLALRKAKPAGQFQLKPEAVLDFIGNLTAQDLPGVGYSLGTKMEDLGVKFVKDIRDISKERLLSSLGPKTGAKLYDYARGIDRTEVGNEVLRKSVSAEVNWGIRFVSQAQAEDFVQSLCAELHRRLVENLVKGKQLTLKVMRRAADAPLEPVKHLGHGKCDVFNKSIILGISTNTKEVLGKEAVTMLRSFNISPGDLRGLGVQMTKLEPLKSGDAEKPESSQQQLNFKASPARKRMEHTVDPDNLESPHKGESETVTSITHNPALDSGHKRLNISGTQFVLPSQPDPEVVAELPNDIRSRLKAQAKPVRDPRPTSPCPPPRQVQAPATELPPQSQLDPETLAALPEDVRAEVLGYYNQSTRDITPQPSTSSAPPARPLSTGPSRIQKPPTPSKKRRGRPPIKTSGNMTLTQSFVRARPPTASNASGPSRQFTPPAEHPEISEDFLAALPEDIRREVLEDHKRNTRLQQRPSNANVAVSAPRRVIQPKPRSQQSAQRRLHLPPLPERPTFTSKKLSNVSDLRAAVGAWHAVFADEGPFTEDVTSLSRYLQRVVVDEKDVDKAVSVVNWLAWLVDDGRESEEALESKRPKVPDSPRDSVTWDGALQSLRVDLNNAVEERGLPPVEFD